MSDNDRLMSAELVVRLTSAANSLHHCSSTRDERVMHDAADWIESQEREIVNLRRQLQEAIALSGTQDVRATALQWAAVFEEIAKAVKPGHHDYLGLIRAAEILRAEARQ